MYSKGYLLLFSLCLAQLYWPCMADTHSRKTELTSEQLDDFADKVDRFLNDALEDIYNTYVKDGRTQGHQTVNQHNGPPTGPHNSSPVIPNQEIHFPLENNQRRTNYDDDYPSQSIRPTRDAFGLEEETLGTPEEEELKRREEEAIRKEEETKRREEELQRRELELYRREIELQQRAEEELIREEEETLRKEAETQRIVEQTQRREVERQRKEEELQRREAEIQKRVEAELIRLGEETLRREIEAQRIKDEELRKERETQRMKEEEVRREEETQRREEEELRRADETLRREAVESLMKAEGENVFASDETPKNERDARRNKDRLFTYVSSSRKRS